MTPIDYPGNVKDYVVGQMDKRDTVLIIIKTTPQQDAAAAAKLESIASTRPQLKSDSSTLWAMGENCSTRSNEALDAAGIYKPSSTDTEVPGTAGGRGVAYGQNPEVIQVPQDGNLSNATSEKLKQFEPRTPLPKPGEPGGTPVVRRPMKTVRVRN